MTKYIEHHGSLNPSHLARIELTVDKAIAEFSKTTAIRFDLRFPFGIDSDNPQFFFNSDARVISRFFESLKEKIHNDLLKMEKNRNSSKVYPNRVRYIWVREQHQSDRQHYHVFIFLNQENYKDLNNSNILRHRLAGKIQEAWCSALKEMPVDVFKTLVHFPEHCVYYIHTDRQQQEVEEDRGEVIYRASYLAKDKTKHYGNGYRSFGCSKY